MPPKAKQSKAVKPAGRTAAKPIAKNPSGTKVTAGKKTGTDASKAFKKKPEAKKWTPEDYASQKIQRFFKRLLAKKQLEKKKREKEEYEALMDKLEKEALVKVVQMQQEEAERLRLKEEEEKRQKREQNKRVKRMLEAAFDGDVDEMKQILKEMTEIDDKNEVGHDVIGIAIRRKHQMALIECEDAHKNTPLSDAGGGGNVDSIKFLLELGGDPNTTGRFKRTPLYRASFAGHLDAVQVLLQNGADPRKYAEDGQTPAHIASNDALRETIENWDIAQTELLLTKLEKEKEKRRDEDRQRIAAETGKLEDQVDEAEKAYKAMQKKIIKCTEELNKRIFEHDHALGEGFENKEILVQVIHEAETDLEIAKIDLEKARDLFSSLRLQLRDKQVEGIEGNGGDADHDLPGLKVAVRELDDVLLRDVGDRIKDSGKQPLIIDTSGQAATFLRYRDTNYLNALNPYEMEAEKVRMALLGAIRYGKPLVLDLMEVDMFQTVSDRFDDIQRGLMNSIMDKSILKEENYIKLLRATDGPAYDKNLFSEDRTKRFSLFIITKHPFPPTELVDNTYCIRVYIPT